MAASGANQQTGVTGPLSLALPTDAERQATDALVDELKRQNNYESAAETNKRYVCNHCHMNLQALRSWHVGIVQSADSYCLSDRPCSIPSNRLQKSSSDMLARRRVYRTVLSRTSVGKLSPLEVIS